MCGGVRGGVVGWVSALGGELTLCGVLILFFMCFCLFILALLGMRSLGYFIIHG